MEDFFAAGGIGAVLRELQPLLHLDCLTVTGETLGRAPRGAAGPVDRAVVQAARADRCSPSGPARRHLFGVLGAAGGHLQALGPPTPNCSIPKFSYTEAQTLPPPSRPSCRPSTTPRRRSTPTGVRRAPTKGPFPSCCSATATGRRLYYSNLLTGIASWGYVVVSADYLERGLAAQALDARPHPPPAHDTAIMMSSLPPWSRRPPTRPPAPRHRRPAAGRRGRTLRRGRTAFDALDSPRVATAIGWAPVRPSGQPSQSRSC